MRRSLPFFVVALVALVSVVFAHHGPETVTLDDAQAKRSAVAFPHAAHQEVVESCVTCHHTAEGLTAENAASKTVQACSTCHLDPEKPTTPSMREMSTSKNPYHQLCVGCHKEQKKGPTTCDSCHPKG